MKNLKITKVEINNLVSMSDENDIGHLCPQDKKLLVARNGVQALCYAKDVRVGDEVTDFRPAKQHTKFHAEERTADETQFIENAIKRGDAVEGELTSGATHEIVGEDTKGQPVIERRRFSIN